MTLEIPFAHTNDVLVTTEDGSPVWPIRSAAELERLRTAVSSFGGELRAVQQPASRPTRIRDGVVVALGAACVPAAGLHAHLTGRAVVTRTSLHDLDDVADVEVVVALWRDIEFSDLPRLLASATRDAVGLIVAGDPEELRDRVLRAAACARIEAGQRDAPWLVLGNDERRLGPRLDAEPVPGAIVHVGHSDGLDLQLSRAEVLCPALAHASADRRPPCVERNWCHRKRMPADSAFEGSDVISTERVAARVLVSITCFGVPARTSVISHQWSLLDRLLANPRIGAIATSWGISIPDDSIARDAGDALASGRPIGNVLRVLSTTPAFTAGRARLVLFGDPRTRAYPRTERFEAPHHAASGEAARPPLEWDADVRRRFATFVLRHVAARDLPADHSDRTIADSLARTTSLFDVWPSLCHPPLLEADNDERCTTCERPLRVFRYELRPSPGHCRRVGTCDRCGIVYDVEAGSDLADTADRARLDGTVWRAPRSADTAEIVVRLRLSDHSERHWRMQGGQSLQLGESADRGGLLTMTLVRREELALLQMRLHDVGELELTADGEDRRAVALH